MTDDCKGKKIIPHMTTAVQENNEMSVVKSY